MGVAPLLACGFAGVATVAAQGQSASTWDKRGANAEAREDYDAAYEAFRQAHLKKPKDLRYKTRYERLRFEAANMHVDRGRVLRQSGDVDGAVNEFARALQIDPGNQAAAQELVDDAEAGAGCECCASRRSGGGRSESGQPDCAGRGGADAAPDSGAERYRVDAGAGDADAGVE